MVCPQNGTGVLKYLVSFHASEIVTLDVFLLLLLGVSEKKKVDILGYYLLYFLDFVIRSAKGVVMMSASDRVKFCWSATTLIPD